VENLWAEAKRHGMCTVRYPIRDRFIPHSFIHFVELVEFVVDRLREGRCGEREREGEGERERGGRGGKERKREKEMFLSIADSVDGTIGVLWFTAMEGRDGQRW
jgi:hypothetical protein